MQSPNDMVMEIRKIKHAQPSFGEDFQNSCICSNGDFTMMKLPKISDRTEHKKIL